MPNSNLGFDLKRFMIYFPVQFFPFVNTSFSLLLCDSSPVLISMMNHFLPFRKLFEEKPHCIYPLIGVTGYDMSPFVRRYAKYLREKSVSYRTVAFDFCKVKRG